MCLNKKEIKILSSLYILCEHCTIISIACCRQSSLSAKSNLQDSSKEEKLSEQERLVITIGALLTPVIFASNSTNWPPEINY